MKKVITIQIDNQELRLDEGTTVLQAAQDIGIGIPTMCYFEGLEKHTSCMMCLVKDKKSGSLLPSCSMPVQEGMEIITKDNEVVEARKTALELLLSEHVGDCEAPCKLSCPAHMDIPKMNRLLAEGRTLEAYQVVMQDIPLPGVLGRICPAPCEKACKRKEIDGPVSICLLKRFSGDTVSGTVYSVNGKTQKGKEGNSGVADIAVVGSGPAGLTAAFYLQLRGYQVTIFEKEKQLGGELRHPDLEDKLPAEILDKEIEVILNTGIKVELGSDRFDHLLMDGGREHEAKNTNDDNSEENFDAIVLAAAVPKFEVLSSKFNKSAPRIFPVQASNLAIQAIGRGKNAAFEVDQYLKGEEVVGEPKRFNSRFGKLVEPEFAEYLKESIDSGRLEPEVFANGFTEEQVKTEAARCLHCDCRKLENCKLRDYSDEYGASQRRFSYSDRKLVTKNIQKDAVIYEPSKCIKCGICVRITKQYQEKYGFTFIGRGFDVEIEIPFGESMAEGLKKTAGLVADACPTGAISRLHPVPAPRPGDDRTQDLTASSPTALDDRTQDPEDMRRGGLPLSGLLIMILLMMISGISAWAQDWPIFRGDQQLLGLSTETFTGNPKLLWSMKPGDGIKASPVVSQGIMVVGADNGFIYAISSTGKKLWEFNTENGIEAPALILNGTVYIGNLYGEVYALDLKTGKEKWKYLTDNQISGSINYFKSGNTLNLLVGSYDYYLHCFDGMTGDSIWQYESDNFINGAAGVFDGKAIFGGCDGFLHIVDIRTGKLDKKVEVATYVASSVAVKNKEAFVGDYDGRFSCVDLVAGEIAWKYEDKNLTLPFIGSPSIKDDYVVIGNRDKNVYCFNRVDGRLLWKTNSGSRVDASPVIIGNKILIANMRGDLQIMDLKTGKLEWNYELGSGIIGNPAVAQGKIWVAASDGFIYCFEK
jgi:outer membrane protein assembly factor BamB